MPENVRKTIQTKVIPRSVTKQIQEKEYKNLKTYNFY